MTIQQPYNLFNPPPQPELIIHSVENNYESKQILEKNREHFSNQCRKVLDALLRGERLSTTSALLKYGIGHLPRRIKDLKEDNNIKVSSELRGGRYKEWFLTEEQIKQLNK